MILIMVFDLFFKYILLLYIMVLAANWSVFVLFVHLTENEEIGHGHVVQNKYNIIFHTFHFLHLVLFGMAFHPTYGAICNDKQIYRMNKFLLLILIFNIAYLYVFVAILNFITVCLMVKFYRDG